MKFQHLEYGIHVPQEINILVLENRVRRKQEKIKTRDRIEVSFTKLFRKKATQRQVLQIHMQQMCQIEHNISGETKIKETKTRMV